VKGTHFTARVLDPAPASFAPHPFFPLSGTFLSTSSICPQL
jgi:hypothetical protein